MNIPVHTASSVTGVGQGSADRRNKGSEHMTLGVNQLIGIRVVAAGSVTMASAGSSSTGVVTFPQALDSTDSYVAFATPVVTASGSAPSNTYAVWGLDVNGFKVVSATAAHGQTVNWHVIRLA